MNPRFAAPFALPCPPQYTHARPWSGVHAVLALDAVKQALKAIAKRTARANETEGVIGRRDHDLDAAFGRRLDEKSEKTMPATA